MRVPHFIRQRFGTVDSNLRRNRPIYESVHDVEILFDEFLADGSCSALDLGCGLTPRNPFHANNSFGVDIRDGSESNVIKADLNQGRIPFPNDFFEYVTAYDVLEHIPRLLFLDGNTVYPVILIMNELFRVLKPAGIFFCIQPCFPAKQVFQDPTHVNIMSEDTMDFYFCQRKYAKMYGFRGDFALVRDGWLDYKYFAFMRKVAPK